MAEQTKNSAFTRYGDSSLKADGDNFALIVERRYKQVETPILSFGDWLRDRFDANNNGKIDGDKYGNAIVGTELYKYNQAQNTAAKRAQLQTLYDQYVTTTQASNDAKRRAIEATVEMELKLKGNENAVDRYSRSDNPNTLQYAYTQQSNNMSKYLIPFVAVVAVVFIIAVLRK